jgi:ubiquinone/menaquinone biosynthesis C-methylase UbiE
MNRHDLSCPICNFTAVKIFLSKYKREIFECQSLECGHFFTPPAFEMQGVCKRPQSIEEESNNFFTQYDERNQRLWSLFEKKILGAKKPFVLLDFGAGNAHISRSIKNTLKDGGIIYCLEKNPYCNGLYSRFGLKEVHDLLEINEPISLVYMVEVIEHLEFPVEILESLQRVFEPSTQLFISTPCGAKNENITNAFDTPSHLHFFTEKSLNLALTISGFNRIVYSNIEELAPRPSKNSIKQVIKNIIMKFNPDYIFNRNKKNIHLAGFTTIINN